MADKVCGNCGDGFGMPEFSSFMLSLKSRTVRCLVCGTENYFVPGWGAKAWLGRLVCIGVGVLFFLAVQALIAAATYNEIDGTIRVSWMALVFGAAFGAILGRVIWNIGVWLFAPLTLDRAHKAAADYG